MRPTFLPSLVNGRFGDPAVFVETPHRHAALLFDLGDLTPLSTRDLLRIEHVFVSHMHMDHFIGFDRFLRVHVGRDKRLTIVGPQGLSEAVGHKLHAYSWDLVDRYAADLVFETIDIGLDGAAAATQFRLKRAFHPEPAVPPLAGAGRLLSWPDFQLTTAILEHHGMSLGYAIQEPVHVNIWKNKLDALGLAPARWLQELKAAVRDHLPDETRITLPDKSSRPLGDLRDLVSVERGQKIAYVTDVADTPANRQSIEALARDADIFFIEASFAAADAHEAKKRAHLTTRAAGEMARAAGVRRVEPFHFSPRYAGSEAPMLAEVAAAFCPRSSEATGSSRSHLRSLSEDPYPDEEARMRDNSGKGKSKNNLRDPTLKEHAAKRGNDPTANPSAERGAKQPSLSRSKTPAHSASNK